MLNSSWHSSAFFKIVAVSAICTLPACASITSDKSQPVSVSTCEVSGAQCELINGEGKYYISSTPGSVVVRNSSADLSINCKKEGYQPAVGLMKRSHKGMAWGNVLAGGIIGYAVDRGTGAAFQYDADINICMTKIPETKAEAIPAPATAAPAMETAAAPEK